MTTGLALFDTDIGRCGVAWGNRGILGVQLPEANDARTLSRLAQKAPEICHDAGCTWMSRRGGGLCGTWSQAAT